MINGHVTDQNDVAEESNESLKEELVYWMAKVSKHDSLTY